MEEEITKELNETGKQNLGLTIKPVVNGYPRVNTASNKVNTRTQINTVQNVGLRWSLSPYTQNKKLVKVGQS